MLGYIDSYFDNFVIQENLMSLILRPSKIKQMFPVRISKNKESGRAAFYFIF